jgi:flagellar biosynthesis/type III secretory pathway chaperone
MTHDTSHLLTSLDAIFDEEREMLIHGRFSDLPAMTERKAAMMDDLRGAIAPDDRTALERVRRRADGSTRLMAASMSGLRAAARRIEVILHAGHSLDTYDWLGRSGTISTAAPDVERRV